jgi:hypothetical protein
VSKFLSAIWVAEAPDVTQDAPNDLQDTPDVPQLLDHFGRRSSDKDPSKPSRSALLQLLLNYMVTSGNLIFDAINEEGVPILRRGDTTHVAGDVRADVTLAPKREMHSIFELQS